MKVVVAIPVYDGKLPAETVRCLLNEQALAIGNGDEMQFRFLPSCSHPAMGRNQLAQYFMESDAEKLFFLDADVTFEPGDLIKLAYKPVDFAGGAYRYKFEKENYPVGWLTPCNAWDPKLGLIEVKSLPGGFLSLSRNVFLSIRAAHPEREYEHFGNKAFCYFQMPFHEGFLYGEDSFFCKEWRDTGGKIYLDPEIVLTHWDYNKPYKGHVGKWLLGSAEKEQSSESMKGPL